jgi:hypothetical protein
VNKLIAVAPVNLDQNLSNNSPAPSASPSASPSEAKTYQVVIYNGTQTKGLAKQEGDTLKAKFSNINISSTANAANNYTSSVVVDLTGENKDFAAALSKELAGKVVSLPEGENKPSGADILIIVGQ